MIERSSFRHARGAATTTSSETIQTAESPKAQTDVRRAGKTTFFTKPIMITVFAAVVLIGLVVAALLYFMRPPADVDPFTAKVTASVQFALYYPKDLPTGFRIDPKSVTEPSAGVVVFDLVNPRKEKIYLSEEARPNKFDIGGFYSKFSNLKEIGTSGGSIATGKLYNGSVSMGGWLDNKDWILCNTSAPVPLSQIQAMLQSLAVNF